MAAADATTSDVKLDLKADSATRKQLIRRFWRLAAGFWRPKQGDRRAWLLTGGLLVVILVTLFFQYQMNVWNRSLFDALEQKDSAGVLRQALIYVPLLVGSIIFAVTNVYVKMTMQRLWREWLTHEVLDRWLHDGRYYHLNLVEGDHENPESRITDDIRYATEAPVDIVAGILAAFLSAVTFIFVLWSVGGALDFQIGGTQYHIPGFLVIAAFVYAMFGTGSMLLIGRSFVRVSEVQNQREAEFRYALTRLRENGESIALLGGEKEERAGLTRNLAALLESWRQVMGQWMRTTFVSSTSGFVASVLPILLCAPKYLAGDMSLGQVMQAASAFVIVQTAFAWLVDNYPRFANWNANARRVASLIASLDALQEAEKSGGIRQIARGQHDGNALQLRGLSVTLDDGTDIVNETEVDIAPGEKVLIVGDSGSGKSTLVRAIAGLWPWGEGEVVMQRNAKLLMLPQRSYVPLGSLRRAATYPLPADQVPDATVREALEAVGLGHQVGRIDEEGPWEQTLSGGEKQRLAFARLLIHKPNLIVLDEATSALDPESQEKLMQLLNEKLPEATLISVGHRPELEAFHERKLVLKHQAGGARLIRDEYLTFIPGAHVQLVRRFKDWRQRRRGQERRAEAANARREKEAKEAEISAVIVGHEKTEVVTDEKATAPPNDKDPSQKKPERTDA
ncbi:MAG: ABC transporter ATP-binding protein/permease [Xanthobacteraceae bacterium]|nr:ABC transporter ATP-binding protein/permease [Xanthobacteraceae bacterium]